MTIVDIFSYFSIKAYIVDIAADSAGFFNQKVLIFFLFFHKNMLWVLIRSIEVLLKSTHNICFC